MDRKKRIGDVKLVIQITMNEPTESRPKKVSIAVEFAFWRTKVPLNADIELLIKTAQRTVYVF